MSASHYIDILIDQDPGERPTVAVATDDLCMQWHDLPPGALAAMHALLERPDAEPDAIAVGRSFAAVVWFFRREGIFGFKLAAADARVDLVRVDLPPGLVEPFRAALAELVPTWDA